MPPIGIRFFRIAALLAFASAISVVVPELEWAVVVADVALAAAWAVDYAAARRAAGRIRATRRWPTLLSQGATAEVTVEIALESPRLASASEGPRSVAVWLRDGLHPGLAAAPVRERVVLSPGKVFRWTYSIVPRRRGEHLALPLTARVEGPWGLAWTSRDAIAAERIRVYPQVRWEGEAGRLLALAHRRQLGLSPTALQGAGSELYGVRRYTEGDPPNRIHWKATARHGTLLAREETWEKSASLVILLDCGRAMASFDGGRSKLDAALAAALALTRFASARGDRVLVVAFSDRVDRRVRVRTGSSGIAHAYASLYDVPARLTESAYDAAAAAARDVEFRSARVVLLTSLVDLAGAELLREALLVLRRHHRPLLVHLEDVEIARLALTVPATSAEAYAKVSAMEVLLGNRELATRLRHAGIESVSTSADRLTLDTLGIYLRSLRARGHRGGSAGRARFSAPGPNSLAAGGRAR
jgi:uncharacterized protein (DUF58 family)